MGSEQEEEEDTGKGEEDFVSKPVLLEEMYFCRIQTQANPLGGTRQLVISQKSTAVRKHVASCPRQHRCMKRFLARKPEHKQM